MTVTFTVLIKFHSNFVCMSYNIWTTWRCDLHYLSNSAWYGNTQCPHNRGQQSSLS